MNHYLAKSLWLRQTIYTIITVVIITLVLAFFEILTSYLREIERQQEFSNHLIDTFSDAAARAAFHIDELQANTVIEGLMRYEVLSGATINTDLGEVLSTRTRPSANSTLNTFTDWLFSDVIYFKRKLIINRSNFIAGLQLAQAEGLTTVGELEIHVNSSLISQNLIKNILSKILSLAIELLLLAIALAILFYKTMTEPLKNVAEQLRSVDPKKHTITNLVPPPKHEEDELGVVVSQTNELLRRIEEQHNNLVHREKVAALGSMLAEVAHELNNPLAVVTTQTELLAETTTDKKTQERAEKILKAVKRCANIVRKFLTLAKHRKIEKSVLNVHKLINESIDMLSFQLRRNTIDIETEIGANCIHVTGDSTQLGQVIINILINAQQSLSTQKGKKEISIKVNSDEVKHSVTISIADNGPGIHADIQDKVFEHFFTTKAEGRGTGLGLSFCKSVIEAHGGTIALKKVEPHGTNVVIVIPGTMEKETEASDNPHLRGSSVPLHVLIVDDEESLASSISEVLIEYGHTTVTANSAVEAMDLLRTDSFDVILADIHMPNTGGTVLYNNAIALDKKLAAKFVFITGDTLDPNLSKFFDTEKKPHLNKPFEIDELIKAVEHASVAEKTTPTYDNMKQGNNHV